VKLHRVQAIPMVFLCMAVSFNQAAWAWMPAKNVEIVVGAGAGGGNDRMARTIQRVMQERKLIPVGAVVINRPGAGGGVAQNYLNQRTGDPHYLMVTNPALITNYLTGLSQLNHTDITPIAQLFTDYVMLVVKSDSPLKTGRDVIERLKKDPGAYSIAVAPAAGAGTHIGTAMVMKAGGINPKALRAVPYATASEAFSALLGGHIDIMPSTARNVQPQLRAGKVRVIGIAAPRRLGGDFAAVPTFREQGADAIFGNWRGVVAPKNLKPDMVAYWEEAFRRLNETEEWKAEMEKNLAESIYKGSADSKQFLEQEFEVLQKTLTELGLGKAY
jgi:putative tricarboxylic transport membrane protein